MRLSDALSLPGRCLWRAVVPGNALRQARLVAAQRVFAPLQGIGGLGGLQPAISQPVWHAQLVSGWTLLDAVHVVYFILHK